MYLFKTNTDSSVLLHAFFTSNTFINNTLSSTAWDWTFVIWKLSIFFNHVTLKNIGQILENEQKNKCFYFSEIIWLIIMKMKMKMENHRKTPDVILVFLFLTLNIFHIFFYYFFCWLLTGKYLLVIGLEFQ